MAPKKDAKKDEKKKGSTKPADKDEALGAPVDDEAEAAAAEDAADEEEAAPADDGKEEVEVDGGKKSAPDKIEPQGKFVVVHFKDGARMYNERGQAVSPVESEAAKITKLVRDAARSNALVRGRTTKTPAGHRDPDADVE